MANPKVASPEFPADWLSDEFHGFSKVGRTRSYRPVLSLNGAQHYFGECKTRVDAARAHDALLKFFLAFTSKRATPNFPTDFAALPSEAALTYEGDGCLTLTKLLTIEEELTAEFETLGRSVAEFRAAREIEIEQSAAKPSRLARCEAVAANARRRALIRLEITTLKNVSFDLTSLVKNLGVPKDKWTPELIAQHGAVDTAFHSAHTALEAYVRNLKTALDLNPNLSTK